MSQLKILRQAKLLPLVTFINLATSESMEPPSQQQLPERPGLERKSSKKILTLFNRKSQSPTSPSPLQDPSSPSSSSGLSDAAARLKRRSLSSKINHFLRSSFNANANANAHIDRVPRSEENAQAHPPEAESGQGVEGNQSQQVSPNH